MYLYEHGGDIYRNKNIKIDLSKSINPLGIPENVKLALIENIDLFSNYPDEKCEKLKESIAKYENVDTKNIVCGNGANELIYGICRALQPKTASLFQPTFSEYEKALKLVNCKFVSEDADIIFICTPNNPTGQLTPINKLKELTKKCKTLVIDECFIDFTEGESFIKYLNDFTNTIVLKAFTKIYSMAGLRLGYAVSANMKLLFELEKQLPCWNVSVPAQIAGIAALSNTGLIKQTVEFVKREREFLMCFMRETLKVYESEANFIFFETKKPIYELMLSHGILIRRFDKTHYRIAVSTRENNEEFIKWLKLL